MNIRYIDNEARFYFICETCGEPIEDLDGVVDFPAFAFSKNIKSPLRFYHRGRCAKVGEKRKFEDMWGDWNLKDFAASLNTGELPAGIRFLNGEDPEEIFKEEK
tara:strand:+ start:249 stop:560 length:312 start_codon:yes stop_codon:yes gene_type:complete